MQEYNLRVEVLGEERGKRRYLALYHGRIRILSKRKNIERAREAIKQARIYGAKIVVMPPYFNTGPVLEFLNLSKKQYIKRFFEQRVDSTIRSISLSAHLERVHVILSSFLEKAGAHYYISSILVNHEGFVDVYYRKIVISPIEARYGVIPGRDIGIFKAKYINIGILIHEEIFYPEIARLYRLLGANIILLSLNPFRYKYPMVNYIPRARVEENKLPIVVLGSIIESKQDIIGAAPTVVYDREGNKIFEYDGNEPILVLIPMDDMSHDPVNRFHDIESIVHVHKIYRKVLKELLSNLRQYSSGEENE